MKIGFDKIAIMALAMSAPLAALSACSSDRAAPPVATGGTGGDGGSTASGGASGSQGGAAGTGGAAAGSAGEAGSSGQAGSAGQAGSSGAGGASGGAGGADAATDSGDDDAGEAEASADASVDAPDVSQEAAVESGVDAPADVSQEAAVEAAVDAPAEVGVDAPPPWDGGVTTIDVTTSTGYWTVDGAGQFLSMWTGKLLAGNTIHELVTGESTPFVIGGDSNWADWERRMSMVITGGVDSLVITHQFGARAWPYSDPNFAAWSAATGCCDYMTDRVVAVDAARGYWYLASGRFSLADGKIVANATGATLNPAYVLVNGDIVYLMANGQVERLSFVTNTREWIAPVGTLTTVMPDAGALTLNGELAVATPPGALVTFRDDATGTDLWKASFKSVGADRIPITVTTGPVAGVATAGLVLQSTGDPAVNAYDAADGTLKWAHPFGGPVDDILVADGGVVYVLVRSESRIYGLDIFSGGVRYEYTNLPSQWYWPNQGEMLLRNGRFYVKLGIKVSSFPAASTSYDPTSPWPVRFHDNQRTNNADSPMTW